MEIKNLSYEINDDFILFNENGITCPCLHSKETEEFISNKIEQNYITNRKKIILGAVEKIKRSIQLGQGAIFLTIYFTLTAIFNILYTLGNHSMFTSPLFISNIVAFLGSQILNSASRVYRKAAQREFKEIDQADTFFKLKDEYNKEEVKNMIEICNPSLFEKIASSKLEQPVNLNIYNQMSSKEKAVTFDIASVLRDSKPLNHEVEEINMFDVEDSTIPEATKIRKMYTR